MNTIMKQKTPDDICETYARKHVKVTFRPLEDDNEVLLIEGDQQALEFLGKLFLSIASSEECGFQMGPMLAGSALFSKESTRGLYIHRLPCNDHPTEE